EGQCCSQCPIGSGVTSHCHSGNDTNCEPCVDGKTFSSNTSHTQVCSQCSECPKNSQVSSECNSTADTACVCDKDFFLAEDGECKLCDLCPAGWGASVSCTRTRNTACNQCTNGTFSKELSATSQCLVCSVCAPGAQMLQACSSTEDTICICKYNFSLTSPHPLTTCSYLSATPKYGCLNATPTHHSLKFPCMSQKGLLNCL
ncbi:hypothetical protein LOTGIDRAFT_139556, partial [Lottia gigantea]